MKLSAVVIAKNSESVIEECLLSLSFCDEIVVVDGGSVDATKEIAKKYHAKIIKGVSDDFALQRNTGLKNAKGEWILYIDTDERISPELRENIRKALEKNDGTAAFLLQRKNFYFGSHVWPSVEKLERLFKKESLSGWYGKLHESPMFTGKQALLEGYLLHFTHRDLFDMVVKTNIWSEAEADLRMTHKHPPMRWWRFFRVMFTGWFDSYISQKGFLAGTAGIVESVYQAFSMFITYAKLWELQKKQ